MPFVSRFSSRNARLRGGLRSTGARFVSVLAAAAILFAAPASVHLEQNFAVTSPGSATSASFIALHSVPSQRLTLEPRSHSGWSPSVDGALPARATAIAVSAIAHSLAIDATLASAKASVAFRGYDAIAPPALS
jgi:hypothetical protein